MREKQIVLFLRCLIGCYIILFFCTFSILALISQNINRNAIEQNKRKIFEFYLKLFYLSYNL